LCEIIHGDGMTSHALTQYATLYSVLQNGETWQ